MWKKVIAPTLLVCVCWVVVSGTSTYGIYRLSRVHENILKENVVSIRAAGRLQESIWRLQAAFLDFLEDAGDAGRSEFDRVEAVFAEALASAETSAFTSSEIGLVATIRERFSAYHDFIHGHLNHAPRDAKMIIAVGDEAAKLAARVAESSSAYLEINERLMTEAAARGARMERMLYVIRLIFIVAGPLLGIYVGLRMARSLQSSISRISVTLNDTSGELDQEIGSVNISPLGNPDELSRLNDQVQAISGRIRQVLSELQKARQEVVRADRLAVVGELAAGIAHELRNPLTSVKLLIQTAPRTDPGIQQQAGFQLQDRQARVVLQEISRMEETISTLLDFARPAQLHRVRHDLRETIRRALSLVEGRAKQAGVIVRSMLPDFPLFVDGDPDQLHQVFGNLFINGIESMSAGGTLQLTAEADIDDAGFARVTVSDSGSGIPQQVVDRIFEPFLTTKERGIGLGLAVTRRIVQEHGGRIWASNQATGGAVFTVELPTVPRVGDLAQGLSRSNADSGLDAALAGLANGAPR